jgi:translocation and assembly module TamB
MPMLTDKPSIVSRPWLMFFIKTGSILALGMLGIVVIGVAIAQWWAQQNLAPMVAQELSKTLNRSIDLGGVKEIGWDRIVFDKSSLPRSKTDATSININEIRVNFDPVKLVTSQILKLEIKAVSPTIQLERGNNGSWLTMPKINAGPPGAIKIEVSRVEVENGRVVLFTNRQTRQSVAINNINTSIDLTNNQQQLRIAAVGEIEGGGKLQVKGESAIDIGRTKVVIRGQKLVAAKVSDILNIPAVNVDRGLVDGNFDIAIEPKKPLYLMGNVILKDARMKITNVPRTFDRVNGYLQVTDKQVKFNNVTTNYDRIAGLINGAIDFQTGYRLNAKTSITQIPDLLATIDVKSPLPIQGNAIGELDLSGKLTAPILTGRFVNSKTVKLDRLTTDRVSGNFTLANGNIAIAAQANLQLGGTVSAQGNVSLAVGNKVRFRIVGKDLPGDNLSQLYNASLPNKLAIGKIAIDGTATGEGGRVSSDLNITAPQATYPTTASINISPDRTIKIKRAETNIAGGKVSTTGIVDGTNWQVNLSPQAIDTTKLAIIAGTNLLPQYTGKLSGKVQLAGLLPTDCPPANRPPGTLLEPTPINTCNSSPIDSMRATGSIDYQLTAGTVRIDSIKIEEGKWQGNISTEAIDLRKLDAQLPTGIASGKFNLVGDRIDEVDPNKIAIVGTGKLNFGGSREIKAERLVINQGNWQGNFTAKNLSIAEFNPQVGGNLDGKFQLAGNINQFTPQSISGAGSGTIGLPQGKITANNFQLDRGKYRGNLLFSALIIGKLLPQIDPKLATAKIDGNFHVAGDIDQPELGQIAAVGSGRVQLNRGTIAAQNLQLQQGKWSGNFALNRVSLDLPNSQIPVGLKIGKLTGQFQAAGEIDRPTSDRLQLAGQGKIDLGNSSISTDRVELNNGNWRSNLQLRNLNLATLGVKLPTQLNNGKLTGDFNLAGNLNRPNPANLTAVGNGKLILNGGSISGKNLQLSQGNWQGNIGIAGLKLGDLNPQLPKSIQIGKIFGEFTAAGNLNNLNPDAIKISGNGQLNDLLGGNIQLANLNLDRGQWQGKLTADRLNIANLRQFAPANNNMPPVTGKLSGAWQLAGNLKDPNPAKLKVNGNTQLSNLAIGELKFHPDLLGNVQIDPTAGVLIALAGGSDRLDLQLDRNLQPQAFNFQQQGVIAKGNVNDKVLDVRVDRFPVSLVQKYLPSNLGLSQYRWQGTAAGNLQLNLAKLEVIGQDLTVDRPAFGAFTGDRLSANFRYRQGKLELDNTILERDKYQYAVSGKIDPAAQIFDFRLQVPQGKLADVRNIFQIASNKDIFRPFNQRKYGTTKDLGRAPFNYRQTSLTQEFHRQAELRRWQEKEQEKQQSNPIPDIGNLEGDFSGVISIASNPKQGLKTEFDLAGTNWKVDRYSLDRVQVTGKSGNGKLTLMPLTLGNGDTQFTVSGNFGLDRQSGDLVIKNAPAEWLASFVELPLDLSGGIDLTAKMDGNPFNPQISGQVTLTTPQLNQTKLAAAGGSFNYQNGRLDFDARATFPSDVPTLDLDRIAIIGSIPYQLPFSNTPPTNRDLKVDISLADRGMQAIDVFSKQQLRWIDGKGNIDVKVAGKVNDAGKIIGMTASGEAQIIGAKIQSNSLAEPITNVDGKIVFDLDRIDVQKLEGSFSRGQISMAGLLPISEYFAIDASQRLAINMKGLAVNIPDKYQGNIEGKLMLKGTALNPAMAGEMTLSNGQVFLPDSSTNTAAIVNGIQPIVEKTTTNGNSLQLRGFQVILGENLQINRPPVLSFVATGKLDIEGSIDNPRPFGQVQLQKGAVNLFTTQFRLANGYPQTADFFPTLGSDPVLNIRLQAKALESNSSPLSQRNSIARSAKGNEINETVDFYSTSLGSVQTVQVEAKIAGLASQVTQRLELTSTPPRTQPEILLLLGGGLVERLSGADNDIGLGIVNLAGSTLLNNIQDRISDTLSLSDFRLFPTVSKESKTSSGSTLGIAAEVGIDLTPKISTSVFKIITNSELPQYSLRYRIDDSVLLRGSTNLFGDNRATVEFEQRF